MTPPARAARAREIHLALTREFPDIRPLLVHSNPFELLIAVILSAQTTDAGVNRVTPELFRRFPDARTLSAAEQAEVESLVRPLGFYHTKARNIRLAAEKIDRGFGGRVPDTMEDLLLLPGVGRKSANVVLFHIYGRPAVIVDTHFGRVVRRLGLTGAGDPAAVERELAGILSEDIRSSFSMRINLHGRKYCKARKPLCGACPIEKLCSFESKNLSH